MHCLSGYQVRNQHRQGEDVWDYISDNVSSKWSSSSLLVKEISKSLEYMDQCAKNLIIINDNCDIDVDSNSIKKDFFF